MSAWSDLVKKLCKQHAGKPLGAILPLAKKIYRKIKMLPNQPKRRLRK